MKLIISILACLFVFLFVGAAMGYSVGDANHCRGEAGCE
jgi:hypothetical protein